MTTKAQRKTLVAIWDAYERRQERHDIRRNPEDPRGYDFYEWDYRPVGPGNDGDTIVLRVGHAKRFGTDDEVAASRRYARIYIRENGEAFITHYDMIIVIEPSDVTRLDEMRAEAEARRRTERWEAYSRKVYGKVI